MWISIIKYCVSILALAVIGGFLSPLYDGSSITVYEKPWYWVGCFIFAFLVYNIVFYFDKLNPRKMYNCIGMFTATVVFPLCTLAFLVAFVCAGGRGSVILMIVTAVLYLFLIYALLHRGVAIYKKGKIRIFKFWMKTYHTNQIDDCILDYNGKKCTVHIIVEGKDHIFKTSALFTKRLEQELKLYTKTYEKELNAVICKKK